MKCEGHPLGHFLTVVAILEGTLAMLFSTMGATKGGKKSVFHKKVGQRNKGELILKFIMAYSENIYKTKEIHHVLNCPSYVESNEALNIH